MRKARSTPAEFESSRTWHDAKPVANEVGDIELNVPRDRAATITPRLVGKDNACWAAYPG
ncbi:hypothetical protein D1871_04745 [Nakamurella silvestris]|nr:hypothetical protein D1871_04745 [Nakamurella silvestris]